MIKNGDRFLYLREFAVGLGNSTIVDCNINEQQSARAFQESNLNPFGFSPAKYHTLTASFMR